MSSRASCFARSPPTPHKEVTGAARGEDLFSAGGIARTIRTATECFNVKGAPASGDGALINSPAPARRARRPARLLQIRRSERLQIARREQAILADQLAC